MVILTGNTLNITSPNQLAFDVPLQLIFLDLSHSIMILCHVTRRYMLTHEHIATLGQAPPLIRELFSWFSVA